MHKMDGTGTFSCLDKYSNFSGEIKNGKFISENQPELKEEKRLVKIYEVLNYVPKEFYKSWEETCGSDPKIVNDVLLTFFSTQENMGNILIIFNFLLTINQNIGLIQSNGFLKKNMRNQEQKKEKKKRRHLSKN